MWGLSFGLPYSFSGDETNKRDAALHLDDTGFRHTANQPSFVYNSLFVIYRAADAVLSDLAPADYTYLGRLWMALLGSLTVLAAWKLGSFFGRSTAWIAGALLAVLPLHTAISRYIKEDAPLGLMATLAAIAIVAYWRAPTRARLALAGACVGFAASTKFNGGIMLLPALVGLGALAAVDRRRPRAFALDLAVLGVAALAGFLLISPIYLVHPQQLLDGLSYQSQYAAEGHDGIAISPWSEWWTYYLRTGLLPGMTWPIAAAAGVGLVLLLRHRGGWILTFSAVAIYLMLEQASAKPAPFSARYLAPLLPMLCVAAAASLATLVTSVSARAHSSMLTAGILGLFVLPAVLKTASIADEANHDTRLRAGAWMTEHIPDGSRLVVVESEENLPASPKWMNGWQIDDRSGNMSTAWDGSPPPYFVVSSFRYDRFLQHPEAVPANTQFYRSLAAEFELVMEFAPRWLTYGKHSPVVRIYRPPRKPRR